MLAAVREKEVRSISKVPGVGQVSAPLKVKVGIKMLQTLPLREMARVLADAGYIIQAPV